MTTQEASKKWCTPVSYVTIYLNAGRVPGACKVKNPRGGKRIWFIPDDAQKPQPINPHRTTANLETQPLSRAEKVEYIRLHSHDKTYAQLKILLGMTHRQIRAVYDDLYERGKI